ncbi:ribosome-releasing factor 2, mitochondrial-like [Oncorhynchus keta]|uniref:ribosome-releasing factor 2, mitochondrial-like n=1 Tax=Oncorhynchus keta TaxID=8018 RepID=UPI0015FE2836|nr:ribosome-releasing factor 2, mitochondrial-like [Oncorhynchus keta]
MFVGDSNTTVVTVLCLSISVGSEAGGGQALEPVMTLEVTVGEEHLSLVLSDLAHGRRAIRDIQIRHKVAVGHRAPGRDDGLLQPTANSDFQHQKALLNKMAGLA